MANLVIKQGDLEPAFTKTLGVDITGADSVTIRLATIAGVEVFVRDVTVVDATTGAVSYTWQAGDTDTAGGYYAEVAVDMVADRPQSYPADGYYSIIIEPKL